MNDRTYYERERRTYYPDGVTKFAMMQDIQKYLDSGWEIDSEGTVGEVDNERYMEVTLRRKVKQ